MSGHKVCFLMIILAFINQSCQKPANKSFDASLRFEESGGKETATYEEMISFYKKAEKHSDNVVVKEMGMTDCGLPLHLVKYSAYKNQEETLKVLILNGIHPGEPDGIDASMLLLKDLINEKNELPQNVELYIVPAYNLGGMLNRNSTSRANQNGPKSYGFRGNAKNYDLNRDFIKADTKNAMAFSELFHDIAPDIFVDTHVSNGADYQYTLTHVMTQHNKLGYGLGEFTEQTFRTALEEDIRSKNMLITPYVNVFGRTPNAGFNQFFDAPRYSTGYTALWHTLGIMIETHMLKPYEDRVISTKSMLESIINLSGLYKNEIIQLRKENFEHFQNNNYYKYHFVLDSTDFNVLNFKGFKSIYETSKVTNLPVLKYLRDQPETFSVKYYNQYQATDSLKIPDYYLIPSAWNEVINRLKMNAVKMTVLDKDSILSVESYRIKDFKTLSDAYEGHYLHYDTKVLSISENIQCKKGDILIPTQQKSIKYIIETLEPELKDSFFNWNFFDSILQQKEGFSAYVFDDFAAEFLSKHPEVKKTFEQKKQEDTTFRNSAYQQLDWIYKKSPLYESTHLRYPVFRVFD